MTIENLTTNYPDWIETAVMWAIYIGIVLAIVGAYFLPTLIAGASGHPHLWAIAACNLLLGWMFIGWVIALIWSLTHPRDY